MKRISKRNLWTAVGMGLGAPVMLYASSIDPNGLFHFAPNTVIKSSEVNENFVMLDERIATYEEAITVDGNRNVGIGTTVPTGLLNIHGSAGGQSIFNSSGKLQIIRNAVGAVLTQSLENRQTPAAATGPVLGFYGDTDGNKCLSEIRAGWNGAANTDAYMAFFTNNAGVTSEAMRIASTGNVGIGTTSPKRRLHVAGKVEFDGLGDGHGILEFGSPGGETGLAGFSNGGIRHDIVWRDDSLGLGGGGQSLVVAAAGNVGIGTPTPTQRLHVVGNVTANDYLYNSDLRLKTEILPLEHASEGIACLQGVTYRWSSRDGGPLDAPHEPQIGLIAQDVERCFPDVVTTDPDGYKSVSYARLVAPLIENAKEQQQALAAQQRELARLRAEQAATSSRLARLEALLNTRR